MSQAPSFLALVAVVGAGKVGSTFAHALLLSGRLPAYCYTDSRQGGKDGG